jgi:hypothetical protein
MRCCRKFVRVAARITGITSQCWWKAGDVPVILHRQLQNRSAFSLIEGTNHALEDHLSAVSRHINVLGIDLGVALESLLDRISNLSSPEAKTMPT